MENFRRKGAIISLDERREGGKNLLLRKKLSNKCSLLRFNREEG